MIRTVSPETVRHFYNKWYHLCNMAVIAVGDFSDTQVLFLFMFFVCYDCVVWLISLLMASTLTISECS